MPALFSTIRLARILRLGLAAFAALVFSSVLPISLTHWHTGNACPEIGTVPACYLVSLCYAAMGIASLSWTKRLSWLFFAGVVPVILLALAGSILELSGNPTCPVSDNGTPLCFYSLAAGVGMLLLYLLVFWLESRASGDTPTMK